MTHARTAVLLLAALSIGSTISCGAKKQARLQNADKLSQLGQAKLKEGDTEGAVADLTQASKLDPKNAEIRHSLGLAYWGKATTMGEESLKLDAAKIILASFDLKGKDQVPGEWRNNLGALYVDLRRWEDAVVELNKAVKDPEYRTPERPLSNLSKASLEQKKCPEAIDYANRALKVQPRFCMALVNRAAAYKCTGNKQAAIDDYLKVTQIEECEAWPGPYLELGKLHLELRKYNEAKQFLLKAKQLDPEGPVGKEADQLLRTIPR